MKNFVQWLAVVCLLTACTPPISEDNLTDIGKSADAVSSVLSSPYKVQRKLISETSEYNNVCSYLSGGTPDLLPPKPTAKPTKTAREMNQVAVAIGGYAKALKEAAGGSSIAKLESSAEALKTEAAGIASAYGLSPTVSPAIEAVVNTGLRIGEANRMSRIREIMDDVYPSLVQLERLLVKDAPSMEDENRKFIGGWERASSCVLRQVRKDPEVAIEYLERIQTDRANIEKEVKLANNAPKVVRSLFEIHILVITEPTDAEFTIKVVQDIYSEIDAIRQAGAPS